MGSDREARVAARYPGRQYRRGNSSSIEPRLATTGNTLSELAVFHLADDYFTTYQSKIEAVNKEDVARVARKYIDFEHLTVLVVGDRNAIERKLKEIPYAQVVHVLDPEGNLLYPKR